MRPLVDTHCWLWQFLAPDRLRSDVVELLTDERHDVFLFVASAWEIVIKHGLGKLKLPTAPEHDIPDSLAAQGYLELPIEQRHVLRLAQLPLHHKDPFDRILVAQSHAEGLHLVTADRLMLAYGVPVIWAGVDAP